MNSVYPTSLTVLFRTCVQSQALKFMSVGVLNTLIDVSLYIFFTRDILLFAIHPLVAKSLSFFVATISSFLFNRYWTFGLRSRPRFAEVLRFYTVVSISMLVNVAGLGVLLRLHVYDLVALGVTTFLTFAISFSLSKVWVFAKKSNVHVRGVSRSAIVPSNTRV